PCPMCSGAILLYNISRVVIGENKSLMGAEDLLRENGVKVDVLNILECRDLLLNYIKNNQLQWDSELEKVGNSTNIF
ncbi:MAG: nucleoside deaminase, partial [Methanobacteriaceae archaeon]|nr:nucleoside deaminase [Methanobacteriaceae archaeon]